MQRSSPAVIGLNLALRHDGDRDVATGSEAPGPSHRRPKVRSSALAWIRDAGSALSTPLLVVLSALLTFAAGRALVQLRGADLQRRLEELQNAHDQAVADSATLSRRYEEQRALVVRGASLDLRLRVVSALDHERLVWPQLLAEVGAALPDEAYLTALESRTRVPLTVELRGRAGDTFAVTRFIDALRRSRSIGAVRLLGTDARVEGVELDEPRLERSFVIEVDYQPSPDSMPELK